MVGKPGENVANNVANEKQLTNNKLLCPLCYSDLLIQFPENEKKTSQRESVQTVQFVGLMN